MPVKKMIYRGYDPPLSFSYIEERLTIDSPLIGVQIRVKGGGGLTSAALAQLDDEKKEVSAEKTPR